MCQVYRCQTIPAGADPSAWGARCAAHDTHQPEPRYLEHHHVIPRAWQHFWKPDAAAANSEGIWHNETVPLCRTGHGNVHYWIERAMSGFQDTAGREPHSEAAIERAMSAAMAGQAMVGRTEHLIARRALEEYGNAGGDLGQLADAGILGGMYGKGDTAEGGTPE